MYKYTQTTGPPAASSLATTVKHTALPTEPAPASSCQHSRAAGSQAR